MACGRWRGLTPASRRGLGRGETGGRNLLRRPAAARSIGSFRRKAQGNDVTVTAIPRAGRPGTREPGVRRRAAAPVGLPVGHGHRRRRRAGDQQPDVPGAAQAAALRAAGQRVLSVAEVRAEHQILRRLRQGSLAFQVPEPVAASDGRTVIGTAAGPASVCRWLPGVSPGMDSETAFERSAGPPGSSAPRRRRALAEVCGLAHRPALGQPDDPRVDVLLRAALGRMSTEQAELLAARPAAPGGGGAARRPARPGHPRRPRAIERAGRPGHGRGERAAGLRARRRRLRCRTSWPRCTTPRRSPRRTGCAARRPSGTAAPRSAAGARPGGGAA